MGMLKSIACAGIVGAGLLVAAPQEANAGNFYFGVGSGSPYYGGYGYGGYNQGYGYGSGYGYGGHGWHNTSHYDYQPARIQRHYGHYDYRPARYNVHRSGHLHHYGH